MLLGRLEYPVESPEHLLLIPSINFPELRFLFFVDPQASHILFQSDGCVYRSLITVSKHFVFALEFLKSLDLLFLFVIRR